jgi:hypothetical protein
VELGSEGGRRRIEAIRKTAKALHRSARRDRRLLEALDLGGTAIELPGRDWRGGGGNPPRSSPESRCATPAQLSSSHPIAEGVREVLNTLGPEQSCSTVAHVRSQAEGLRADELVGFLERAPWRTMPERWGDEPPGGEPSGCIGTSPSGMSSAG